MPFFPPEFVQKVIDSNDIVEIVSASVRLQGSGDRLKGLCPFHKEKTPSFTVGRDTQMYHCFGCGKGGTTLNFVMQQQGLDFVDGVKFLAERANIDWTAYNSKVKSGRNRGGSGLNGAGGSAEYGETMVTKIDQRKILVNLNRDVARYYRDMLHSPLGNKVMEYARERQISDKTIAKFGLGYAPDNKEIIEVLHDKGYTDEQILLAGITAKGERGDVYLRFRDRFMFPIIDVRGNVIAFGGRIIGDGKPKYLNSAQTPLFNKSVNLFALNLAKLNKQTYFLLVEGYMDVVMLHQCGIDMAIATLGTALTEEQAKIIKRYRRQVIISYDTDEAGQNATRRAIDICRRAGLEIKILQLKTPTGQEKAKDPDEYIKRFGVGAFKQQLDNSPSDMAFLSDKLREGLDLTESFNKTKYIHDVAREFTKIDSPVELEIYAQNIATQTGVSVHNILQEVGMIKSEMKNFGGFSGAHDDEVIERDRRHAKKNDDAENILLALMMQDVSALKEAKKCVNPQDFSQGNDEIAEMLLNGEEVKSLLSNEKFADKASVISSMMFERNIIGDVVTTVRELSERIKKERMDYLIKQAMDEKNIDEVNRLFKQKREMGNSA
ncbi:MAG: DNA primase [Clostridiales bacterium]|jgi:DNA primase|nr:DNA primase [Clostridiales bacterium]